MVAGIEGGDARETAEEVCQSLRHGDHLRHNRQLLRTVVSLVLLFLLPLSRKKSLEASAVAMTLVIANPVAHGSRFGAAVFQALHSLHPNVAADRRLADSTLLNVHTNFPSLSVFSLAGFVNIRNLRLAMRLRKVAILNRGDYPSLSRAYLECLFLMQAIRYSLAADLVQAHATKHLWLTDFDRDAYCRPLMWHARRLGRPTATLVHGTPGRSYLPPIADNILVWGDAQLKWFQQRAPTCDLFLVGRPELTTRIVSEVPTNLRIVHSKEKLLQSEQKSLETICAMARNSGLHISLRLHPSAEEADLDEVWRKALGRFERESNGSSFVESFSQGDIVVGITSTAIVDALACGLPAWTIADNERELPCDLAGLRKSMPSQWHDVFERLGPLSDSSAALASRSSEVIVATGDDSSRLILGAVKKILSHQTDVTMQI